MPAKKPVNPPKSPYIRQQESRAPQILVAIAFPVLTGLRALQYYRLNPGG